PSSRSAPYRASSGYSACGWRPRKASIPALDVGETFDARTGASWRAWLKRNHAKKKEIWLVYHDKSSGKRSISYNDSVDEALAFGWIDSTVDRKSTRLNSSHQI